jgi:2-polyprenyl-3-methyl-5-hydroxy-6-metoxy-1,4-benzoquinol methylase
MMCIGGVKGASTFTDDDGEKRTVYSGSVNEQFVYECIIKKCNIDEHTSYVDVGAGIGNTVIHIAMTAGCKSTG